MPKSASINRLPTANSEEVEDQGQDQDQEQEESGGSSVMDLHVYTFKIVGISPLLQNNPALFIGHQEAESLSGKKKYDDEEEARMRVYQDGEGNYVMPSESFKRALLRAASGKKFGKAKAPEVVRSAVFLGGPYCILTDPKIGRPLKKYTIDRRSVVINRARVLRCRPCWERWATEVSLEIDLSVVHPDAVLTTLQLAGRFPGIGDYRPEKGGAYGRFQCSGYEEG